MKQDLVLVFIIILAAGFAANTFPFGKLTQNQKLLGQASFGTLLFLIAQKS